MKKLFISLFLLVSIVPSRAQETWPTVSAEQAEIEAIMYGIMQIKEYFVAGGGLRSSAFRGAITRYLQAIGTPISYSIYLKMKKSGEI